MLEVPGVSLYSLQMGKGAEQLGALSGQVEDLAPELTDWAATAAAMMELDLIISVDTSCAHLAGAPGVFAEVARDLAALAISGKPRGG